MGSIGTSGEAALQSGATFDAATPRAGENHHDEHHYAEDLAPTEQATGGIMTGNDDRKERQTKKVGIFF